MLKNKIAIIGGGCGAAECIKAIRENDLDVEIHLFTDSIWPIYNPMLVTYYACSKIDFTDIFPYGTEEFFKVNNVNVHMGGKVIKLDAINKTLIISNGEIFKFDKCLISSGATPFVPPIAGINNRKVYYVRTVEDAIKLKGLMKSKPEKALVVGASMVGIKMVEMFIKEGVTTYFADLADYIFPLSANRKCAEILQNSLVEKGVILRLGKAMNNVEENEKGILQAYYNGVDEADEVDAIIMCAGVRTNLQYVDKNEIEINKGIIVDEFMKSSLNYIYAAGDVAEAYNILTEKNEVIGLLASAREQGRIAGLNMTGDSVKYKGNLPHNITHFLDVDFIGIGNLKDGDSFIENNNGNKYYRFNFDGKKLIGINLLNYPNVSGVLKKYFINNMTGTDNILDDKIALKRIFAKCPELKTVIEKGLQNGC